MSFKFETGEWCWIITLSLSWSFKSGRPKLDVESNIWKLNLLEIFLSSLRGYVKFKLKV